MWSIGLYLLAISGAATIVGLGFLVFAAIFGPIDER
jgi:hypothetical protein